MTSQLPWKPWHRVVTLRDDLRTGELALNQFAADLYEVLMQSGERPLYEDPRQFFALTYPTHNLRELARDVALRLAGQSDKAVRQLELTYGGGKTHTLITLRHLFHDPAHLPELPAVQEFVQHIGEPLPRARMAALCFDKLDLEKGLEVRAPDGQTRRLKQPWSLLAYQLAGNAGLAQMRDDRQRRGAHHRAGGFGHRPPAGIGDATRFERPGADRRSDDVRARQTRPGPHGAGAVDRLFPGVDPSRRQSVPLRHGGLVAGQRSQPDDTLGRGLQGQLYDIFKRQSEQAIEPVVRDDVAEVLRRRFFTPESIKDRDAFRPHVIAALKGIQVFDETAKGKKVENHFLQSYPFHPDLTDVFYSKWTSLDRFQKTRGVLRTFALALRQAEQWDTSPLIGPAAFLNAAGQSDLTEATHQLCTDADTEDDSGRKQAWVGLLSGELDRARHLQDRSVGLKHRELEQAVIATFLHSQPIGRTAKTLDLLRLLGPTRPDKINLEKGLRGWADDSHWLDDRYTAPAPDQPLPKEWRLGNRPNLKHMHDQAEKDIAAEVVAAQVEKEIGKLKSWFQVPPGLGVRVHILPRQPGDIEDDGAFHFAVLGPNAASEAAAPSQEAVRFLTEKTGPATPRAYPNAVLLVAPSRDGLAAVRARIRDYLAWEKVEADLDKVEGTVDPARKTQLQTKLQAAKQNIPGLLRQAYSVVVTIAAQGQPQAFRLTVSDGPLFDAVKASAEARIKDAAIDADALLPGGPYRLWHDSDTRQRVKVLVNAFAERPALPKMLRTQDIYDTLADGCTQGSFVLLLTRPDRSVRTWWRTRPDEAVMKDKDLELVLPAVATLAELDGALLEPGRLPGLWSGDTLGVGQVYAYFQGGHAVNVDKGGFEEPVFVPRAEQATVAAAIQTAVAAGRLWLVNEPASILAEPIPTGVLTETAVLLTPPAPVNALELLPANLPEAWADGAATAATLAEALSRKTGLPLPWKTVRDAIDSALSARYLQVEGGAWPCEYHAAAHVRLQERKVEPVKPPPPDTASYPPKPTYKIHVAVAEAQLAANEVQDLGEAIPALLALLAASQTPLRFTVRLELGDGQTTPSTELIEKIDAVLSKVQDGWRLGR